MGRFVVWKAYSRLAEAGLITLEGRRRAVVNSRSGQDKAGALLQLCEFLSRDLLARTRALGINPSAFIRFFDQVMKNTHEIERDVVFVECNAVQTRRWSSEISAMWGVTIPGLDFAGVRAMPSLEREQVRVVLTPLLHEEEVRTLFTHPGTQVIPLGQTWNDTTLDKLRALGNARIGLILEKSEVSSYGESFGKEIKARCPQLKVDILAFRDVEHARTLLASDKYARVYLSGPVQERFGDSLEMTNKLLEHLVELDRSSLEAARVASGVVI